MLQMSTIHTSPHGSADVQLAVRPQRRVSLRVADLALHQASRIGDGLQVGQRAVALEAHLHTQHNSLKALRNSDHRRRASDSWMCW